MLRTFFWLSVVVLAATTVAAVIAIKSASAQTTQTPQIAYVQYSNITNANCCPPGSGACDAFCPYPDLETFTVVTPFGGTNGSYDTQPTWSADGTKIAFTRNNDISVADANGANAVSITNTGNNQDPAWSPAGARIAFMTTRDGHSELYLMNADGSNVVRLTYNVGFSVGHPAWSRDGARIAFNCVVETGNDDICAISPDGTGFARLTTDPASDSGPTWSPDGMSIAFSTTRYGPASVIALMNADGSGVSQVGVGVQGGNPAWSPDGAEIAFDVPGYDLYTMKADGTGVALFMNSAFEPAWMPAHVPVATFEFACSGPTCNFDASRSRDPYGTVTNYSWNFGDQRTGTGATVAHTYVSGAAYTVKLAVTDNNAATGTKIQIVAINPVASFTFSCNGLACSFDGSGSKDATATITSYAWNFGDGTTGAGVTVGHTYPAGGTYDVALTVTDNVGATGTQSNTVTVFNIPPVASFAFACNLLTCSFDGSGSHDPDGTITSYAWNFGDRTTGSGPSVSHTYAAGGHYIATLTVTDNAGASNAQSQTVVANAPPVASFTFSCSRFTCSFDASTSNDSDGTIASWAWNFGDGTKLTGNYEFVGHTYRAPGTYTVTLVVTDNGGATSTKSNIVTVPPRG